MDQFPWLGRPFCVDGRVGEHPCTQRKLLACSAAQFEITPQAEGPGWLRIYYMETVRNCFTAFTCGRLLPRKRLIKTPKTATARKAHSIRPEVTIPVLWEITP